MIKVLDIEHIPSTSTEELRMFQKRIKKELSLRRKESRIENLDSASGKSVKDATLLLKRKKLQAEFVKRFCNYYHTNNLNNLYPLQFADPQWRAKREEVMRLKGHVCQVCGSTDMINIHHSYYMTGSFIWEYPAKDMFVLCEKCHKAIHDVYKPLILMDSDLTEKCVAKCSGFINAMRVSSLTKKSETTNER